MKIEIWSRALAEVGDKNITVKIKSFKLSNHADLKKIAAECELGGDEVEDVLSGERYAEAVREDELQAARLWIYGVPYFVIGGKYGLSGAQPPEILKRAITEVLMEESFNGMTCGADGCHFDD
ncbi:MAG: DsbA family protein [Selenomonadaceae bacterium]|nr:DsbA family protein [Selenomonadaceae bacterium]